MTLCVRVCVCVCVCVCLCVCVCVSQEGQSRPGSSLLFCSPNCSAVYTSDLQSRAAGNKVRHQIISY